MLEFSCRPSNYRAQPGYVKEYLANPAGFSFTDGRCRRRRLRGCDSVLGRVRFRPGILSMLLCRVSALHQAGS